MKKKSKPVCSSCKKELPEEHIPNGEDIFCEKCRPYTDMLVSESESTTKTKRPLDEAATRTHHGSEQKLKDMEGENIAENSSNGFSEQSVLKLTTNSAAIKKIKEVFKIEPNIDLEHTSKIYFGEKENQTDIESGSSIEELISSAAEDNKYIFNKEIGRGGMGTVFETIDQDIRRKVAMKVLHSGTDKAISSIKRFLEEAQITGQLEHPNIIPVHEIGIDDELKTYFTMKLVKGEDLKSILSRLADGNQAYKEKYSLGTLLQIFMKICDGIGYAHSKGVLHRDLKPENIMAGDFGEVLVMDWGIAKILGHDDIKTEDSQSMPMDEETALHTREGEIIGTYEYLSPEQALGEISALDEKSDIFSLGGILYKILTYQTPYKGVSSLDKLQKAQLRDLIPPDIRAPENHIPPELNAICMKAMAKDKKDRYPSVLDLKQDLQLYLDGKSVSAKKDNLFVRIKKWVIRNKVEAMGAAAAIICLIAGIIFTVIFEHNKKLNTIAELLNQGEQARIEERYEDAEEIFFSVLGLDDNNLPARKGISLVSGKALSLKNKRIAKEKIKDANALFENKEYIKAYDAYVATFALDPDSVDAREGIKKSAIRAEKQKAQEKIKPILNDTLHLSERKKEIDRTISLLTEKTKSLKSKIKGFEGVERKKPFWNHEKNLLQKKIDALTLEGKIISKYSTILSHDGEHKEARKALAKIYYNKFKDSEMLQKNEEMVYFKELIQTFDDGYYKKLLQRDGTVTLTTVPKADAYFIYRFIEGPDRRMIPAPFRPQMDSFFRKNAEKKDILFGIDPEFDLTQTTFWPTRKILKFKSYNQVKNFNKLRLPAGSYLIIAQKEDFKDTRIPVYIKRGDDKVLVNINLVRQKDMPDGFVYIPGGEFIMGGDPDAPYSTEMKTKFPDGFLISQHEVTVKDYLKFINDLENRLPDSAEKYLPRRSATAGFYWEKIGNRYKSNFPLDWPVLGVSWNDAQAFCKWMTFQNKNKGWKFRLPEDWEWEKAARGVDGRFYPWGNYFDFRFCSMANSQKGKRNGPDKIGSFPLDESVYGVMDTAGNVTEWCNTFFDKEKNIRINRGSAWSYVDNDFARCSSRNGHSPVDVADFRGFRMVLSISSL